MSSKSRSEQRAEGVTLRQRRHALFRGHCSHIAKMHATMLFEDDGAVFAERDGVRWLLHQAVDPAAIWYETWQLLRDTPSALTPPVTAERVR
jgi:hypothetical protein